MDTRVYAQAEKKLGFFAMGVARPSEYANRSIYSKKYRIIDVPYYTVLYVTFACIRARKRAKQKMLFCYSDPTFGDFSKVWTPVRVWRR